MRIRKSLIAVLLLFLALNLSAESLKNVVKETMGTNPEVQSLRTNVKAFRMYVDEERGKYFPKIDLDTYYENKETEEDNQDDEHQNGTNTQLKLEQIIFDGGLISSKVEEADFNYESNRLKSLARVEEIVLETVEAYLDTVRNTELSMLWVNNVNIHEDYLVTAKQSEDVSGDSLDRLQVESKLFTAKADYVEVRSNTMTAQAQMAKLMSRELQGTFCRPKVDETIIEKDVSLFSENAVKVNFVVREELEKIKAQRAILSQEGARFFPTIKVRLLREIDDGVDEKDIKKTEDTVRVSLSYNLFNGLQDKAIYEREKLFLQESQEKLDDVVNSVVEDVKTNHAKFFSAKERIEFLKQALDRDKKILNVYLEQFEGGTRSFLDILNQEAQLFQSKQDLIEEEYAYLNAYFSLLNTLGQSSETILTSQDQVCEKIVVDTERRDLKSVNEQDDADLEALFSEDDSEEKKERQQKEIDSMYKKILGEITNPKVKNKNIKINTPVRSIQKKLTPQKKTETPEGDSSNKKEPGKKVEKQPAEEAAVTSPKQDKEALKRRLENIINQHKSKKQTQKEIS
jgi:adhesin transport system outer membrane protein